MNTVGRVAQGAVTETAQLSWPSISGIAQESFGMSRVVFFDTGCTVFGGAVDGKKPL